MQRKPDEEKAKIISITLPKDLVKQFDDFRWAAHMSRSQAIKIAILKMMEEKLIAGNKE